jgi:hypothetical protein
MLFDECDNASKFSHHWSAFENFVAENLGFLVVFPWGLECTYCTGV